MADGDAEVGYWYAQAAALGGDAQVGGDGELAAAAGGEPADHRYNRRADLRNGFQQAVHGGVVHAAFGRVAAVLLEVADVRARGEGCFTRTGDDHATDVPVGVQVAQQLGQRNPHVQRDGVALGWPVDGYGGHRRFPPHEDMFVGINRRIVGWNLQGGGVVHRRALLDMVELWWRKRLSGRGPTVN